MIKILKSAMAILVFFTLVGFLNVVICNNATRAENINKCTTKLEDGSILWIIPVDAEPGMYYLN